MAKKKWLTVGELIEVLSKYDQSMKTVVLRDGNGHYSRVMENDVKVEKDPYFGDDTDLKEGTKVLRIAIV